MRLNLRPRLSSSLDEPAAEKVFAAEKDIAAVRLAVIALNTAVYFFLFEKSGSIQWLAYSILAAAWIYCIVVLAVQPHKRYPALLSSYFTSTSDATLITLWLVATGGFDSPYYVLWYASIVAVAYRYTPKATMTTAAVYSACYMGLLAALAGIAGHATELALRIGYIFLVGLGSSLISREALGQSRARVEAREAAERAEAAEERFRRLSELSVEGIAIHDRGVILDANRALAGMFGYELSEMIGKKVLEFVAEESRDAARANIAGDVEKPIEYVAMRKDGSTFSVEVAARYYTHERREVRVAVLRDLTERKASEQALRDSEARFRALTENASDFVFIIDRQGILRYGSPSVERMLGYSQGEFVGRSSFEFVHPDDAQELTQILAKRLQTRGVGVPIEFRVRHGDGSWRLLEAIGNFDLLDDPAIGGFILNARDITERRQAEETITRLAYHDSLTGLPNRALFEDRLSVALVQARRSNEILAVMFLDLDRFKLVNDTIGHAGGDQLLQMAGNELNEVVRDADSVARLGGDEFGVLLTRIRTKEEVIEVAERLLSKLDSPKLLGGHEFRITTSIGISIYPKDGADQQELLANADAAMYRAKERGRNNYQLYTRAMKADVLERLALESDLRHALERGEFVLHYQPIVDMATGEIIAAEALARWQHPARGLVFPDDFIPFAEEHGLLTVIDEWVLAEACGQNKKWQQKGYPEIRMSVNLSARQLQRKELPALLSRTLKQADLAGEHLQLEITEGAVMENTEAVVETLRRLRTLGMRISIDDFGTGYSSLSYLKRFPIDEVKIDRSFVRDLAVDPKDATIVSTIITMAHDLKLGVVGEGVESADQLRFLKERGCDAFQGYLFSKPLPASEFEKLLSKREAVTTAFG